MSVEDGRRPAQPEPWDKTLEPKNNLERLIASAPAVPCTCPSGDASLRWPCPTHPNANYSRLASSFRPHTLNTSLAADNAAAQAPAEQLKPLDYRAQGREEALQIILGQDPEDPFSDCIGSSPNGDAGDYSSHWNEEKLRAMLHIGDRKHDAYDRAEAMYWQARGEKDEAERMMRMAERAPYLRRLEEFLCKQQSEEAWALLADLKREATHQPVAVDQATVDKHLDAVLRAAGSALRYYSMPKSLNDMRTAMRVAMGRSAITDEI